jgi:hypothetical protein
MANVNNNEIVISYNVNNGVIIGINNGNGVISMAIIIMA